MWLMSENAPCLSMKYWIERNCSIIIRLRGLLVWNDINCQSYQVLLTRWDQVVHIYVSKLTITCSDNGLPPGQLQAIICTNAGILLIRTLGTNISEIVSEIHTFSLKKMHLKMSSAKWRLFCLGLNVLSNKIIPQGSLMCTKAFMWHCTLHVRP